MQPTLLNGQRFFVTPGTEHKAKRFDVMVMRAGRGVQGQIVKRVIGLPGDRVEIATPAAGPSQVLVQPGGAGPWFEVVNPAWQGQNFINVQCCDENGHKANPKPASVVVPSGKVWVLGDNPDESSDSRDFGFVDLSVVDGRVGWRVWPLTAAHEIGNRPVLKEVQAPTL